MRIAAARATRGDLAAAQRSRRVPGNRSQHDQEGRRRAEEVEEVGPDRGDTLEVAVVGGLDRAENVETGQQPPAVRRRPAAPRRRRPPRRPSTRKPSRRQRTSPAQPPTTGSAYEKKEARARSGRSEDDPRAAEREQEDRPRPAPVSRTARRPWSPRRSARSERKSRAAPPHSPSARRTAGGRACRAAASPPPRPRWSAPTSPRALSSPKMSRNRTSPGGCPATWSGRVGTSSAKLSRNGPTPIFSSSIAARYSSRPELTGRTTFGSVPRLRARSGPRSGPAAKRGPGRTGRPRRPRPVPGGPVEREGRRPVRGASPATATTSQPLKTGSQNRVSGWSRCPPVDPELLRDQPDYQGRSDQLVTIQGTRSPLGGGRSHPPVAAGSGASQLGEPTLPDRPDFSWHQSGRATASASIPSVPTQAHRNHSLTSPGPSSRRLRIRVADPGGSSSTRARTPWPEQRRGAREQPLRARHRSRCCRRSAAPSSSCRPPAGRRPNRESTFALRARAMSTARPDSSTPVASTPRAVSATR